MAKVTVSLGEQALRKEQQGIDFRAKDSSGTTIGTLRVSTGGFRWLSNNEQERGGWHFVNWTEFDDFMKMQRRVKSKSE